MSLQWFSGLTKCSPCGLHAEQTSKWPRNSFEPVAMQLASISGLFGTLSLKEDHPCHCRCHLEPFEKLWRCRLPKVCAFSSHHKMHFPLQRSLRVPVRWFFNAATHLLRGCRICHSTQSSPWDSTEITASRENRKIFIAHKFRLNVRIFKIPTQWRLAYPEIRLAISSNKKFLTKNCENQNFFAISLNFFGQSISLRKFRGKLCIVVTYNVSRNLRTM